MKFIFKLIPLIFLIFPSTNVYGQSKNGIKAREDSVMIQVKTFLHLFEHNASYLQKNATYYYLSVDDSLTNTMNDVFERLKTANSKVKLIKEYQDLTKLEKDKIKYLSFKITRMGFITKKKVYVGTGYHEGPLSSSGNVITLKKWLGKWRIVRDDLIWIS